MIYIYIYISGLTRRAENTCDATMHFMKHSFNINYHSLSINAFNVHVHLRQEIAYTSRSVNTPICDVRACASISLSLEFEFACLCVYWGSCTFRKKIYTHALVNTRRFFLFRFFFYFFPIDAPSSTICLRDRWRRLEKLRGHKSAGQIGRLADKTHACARVTLEEKNTATLPNCTAMN